MELKRDYKYRKNKPGCKVKKIQWQEKRGCLKSQNPLTAKDTKVSRKVRKEFNINAFTLRALRQLSVLSG
jgi:hypothetical protein